jgi:hypothetical protein
MLQQKRTTANRELMTKALKYSKVRRPSNIGVTATNEIELNEIDSLLVGETIERGGIK